MVIYSRIFLATSLIGLTSLGAIPAAAEGVPTVIGSFAEQVALNRTRFTLLFDAPIENLTSDDFRITEGCSFGYLEVQDATAQVDLLDCPSGLVDLVVLAHSVGSTVLGPAENHVVGIEIDATVPGVPSPEPTPTPTPEPSPTSPPTPTPEPSPTSPPVTTPEPTPTPVAELPTASPEIQPSSSPSVSDSAVATVSESETVEWDPELVVVTITPPANSEPEETALNQESLLAALQEENDTQAVESPKLVEVTSEEVVIESIAGDEVELEVTRSPQWIWFFGLGSLTLLVIGLIRRFSGR